MNSVTARNARHSHPIRLIIICGIIVVGVVIAVTASLLLNLRNRDLAEKARTLQSLALMVADQVDRNLTSIELVQNSVIERMQSLGIASAEDLRRQMSSLDIQKSLKEQISLLPHIDAIILTDNQGKLINFSRSWPVPNITNRDQDPSEAFRSNPHLTFFVGRPVRSPATGFWILPIARKFTSPSVEFLGVVMGVMRLQYFEDIFKSILPGDGSSIALQLDDGTLLVRYPHIEPIIGHTFVGGIKALGDRRHGTIRLVAKTDGKDRLLAAQRLADFPLIVTVGDDVSVALASWRRGAVTMTAAALMIGLVIGGITLLCIWLVGKSLREKNFQRDTALETMAQGLCMFDEAQRLIVCNKRFSELYRLSSDQTKPGTEMRTLLEYRISVGTAPEEYEKYVSSRSAGIATHRPYQATNKLNDGRYVSVVHQPLQGGGWVATHEDVTEHMLREESFRLLFDSNPVPMWVMDRESFRFLAVNEAAVEIYGYSRERFMSMTALDLRPAEDREGFAAVIRALPDCQFVGNYLQHLKANGTPIDVCAYSRSLTYQDRNARLVVIHDITKRKQAEEELHRIQKFLDTVIENVPVPIMVKDIPSSATNAANCRYSLVNRACEKLFGVSRRQIIGKTIAEMHPKEVANLIIAENNKALLSHQAITLPDHEIKTVDNDIRLVTAKDIAVRNDEGEAELLLTVLDDVTERRRTEQRITHMAHYDTLADLPNRAAFGETLGTTLDRAGPTGKRFAVLSIDLDRFKEANDTYGHLVGDGLLSETARRLKAAAGEAFLARLGGDEFALIVTEGEQPATAAALADRLLATVVDDFEVERHRLKLSMSIGIAIYPTDGSDAKTLMSNADAALYRAKADFRGMAMFCEPGMSARLQERYALQEDLRLAINRGELLLHYQPQKKITGETIGFEALARWQCPKRGMVAPSTFIPIAEESSLIISLGEWVLREACREAASWSQPLTVAVNVSPIQFRYGELPRLVHTILLETGLAPGRLELEITEGVMVNDFSRAVSILNRLKSLGVRIAMDDFGTGYSSLSYLQSFRCDKIKIDRAFIRDLEQNHHSRSIARAIIGLGRSLNLSILAEGVETEAQHAFLTQEGCDEVQGYLTGRPLPIADHAELVGRRAVAQQKYALVG